MQTYLKALLESLVSGLSAEPRVAANVCWAFTSLAERAYEMAEEQATANGTADDSDTPQTYCLSQARTDDIGIAKNDHEFIIRWSDDSVRIFNSMVQ